SHLVEPGRARVAVAGRDPRQWRTEIVAGVDEKGGFPRRGVHDPAGRVDDASEITRPRDQSRETDSAFQLLACLDLGRDVVRDDRDDVAIDSDHVDIAPLGPTAGLSNAELRVYALAGRQRSFIEGNNCGVVDYGVEF